MKASPGNGIEIDIGTDGSPLTCGNHRYWEPMCDAFLREHLGEFIPRIRDIQGPDGKGWVFLADDKSGNEILGKTSPIMDDGKRVAKVPRAEISRLVNAINALHAFSQSEDGQSWERDLAAGLKLPNPSAMPEAWRITGGRNRKLFVLWGYDSGARTDSVVLPQTVTSSSWKDAPDRIDLKEQLRKMGGLGWTRLNPAWVFKRVVMPVLLVAALAAGAFGVYKYMHPTPVYCEIHADQQLPNRGKGPCPRICVVCRKHLGADGKCSDTCDESGHAGTHFVRGVCPVCHPEVLRCNVHPGEYLDEDGKCALVCDVCKSHLNAQMKCADKCETCGKHFKFGTDNCKGDCKLCGKHIGGLSDPCKGYCDRHVRHHRNVTGTCDLCEKEDKEAYYKAVRELCDVLEKLDSAKAEELELLKQLTDKVGESQTFLKKIESCVSTTNKLEEARKLLVQATNGLGKVEDGVSHFSHSGSRKEDLRKIKDLQDRLKSIENDRLEAKKIIDAVTPAMAESSNLVSKVEANCDFINQFSANCNAAYAELEKYLPEAESSHQKLLELIRKLDGRGGDSRESVARASELLQRYYATTNAVQVAIAKRAGTKAPTSTKLRTRAKAGRKNLEAMAEQCVKLEKAASAISRKWETKKMIMQLLNYERNIPPFSVEPGSDQKKGKYFTLSYERDGVDPKAKRSWKVSVPREAKKSKPVELDGDYDKAKGTFRIYESEIKKAAKKAEIVGNVPVHLTVTVGKVTETCELLLKGDNLNLVIKGR